MTLLLLTTTTTTTTMAQNNDNYIGSTPSQRLYINAVQAQTAVNAALAQAIAIGSPSNIAITDPSGLLVAFLREDNAFPGKSVKGWVLPTGRCLVNERTGTASIDISIKKARTVSLFNGAFTTAALYSQAQPGASLYGEFPDLLSEMCFPAPIYASWMPLQSPRERFSPRRPGERFSSRRLGEVGDNSRRGGCTSLASTKEETCAMRPSMLKTLLPKPLPSGTARR